ncbi:MAG: site-2 protease family protein [Propionibacteriaceae bacterium]|nr:site-2 protease family protein [Propionibacteriaceae bacterium]
MNNIGVMIGGALLFFALILISVGLHEVGHFIPGKLFKVRVLQFFIGFGKNIWKTQKGETEYGIKIIPLGGYVRMLGMYPPYKEGKDTRLKRMADAAREGEWELITDEDIAGNRLYYQKPLWQRLIIMFSGVGMNLILAFLLFAGVNLFYGQPETSLTIARVSACVDSQAEECVPPPAITMGLRVGDTVVRFNGTEVSNWSQLSDAIKASGEGMVQLSVDRDGKVIELPEVEGMYYVAEDPNNPGETIHVGFIGISMLRVMAKVGPGQTLKEMASMTGQVVKAIIKLPVSAWIAVVNMVTGQERDPNGPMSILGASILAGDVAALDAPVGARAAFFVQLLASVNLFVGMMNLVPLLPFDGGHVAAGIFEGIRRWVAKLRGKPDPGPADTAKLLPVTYVMMAFLILIGAVFIIADIISPILLS